MWPGGPGSRGPRSQTPVWLGISIPVSKAVSNDVGRVSAASVGCGLWAVGKWVSRLGRRYEKPAAEQPAVNRTSGAAAELQNYWAQLQSREISAEAQRNGKQGGFPAIPFACRSTVM